MASHPLLPSLNLPNAEWLPEQAAALNQAGCLFEVSVVKRDFQQLADLDEARCAQLIQVANALYRSGYPIVSDADYDASLIPELQRRNPDHPFLQSVEPEAVIAEKTVLLPEKMLSTDKAYHFEDIQRWVERILKAANTLGVADEALIFQITPKLDGYAAFDDGTTLYTRGDGIRGQDISRAFDRGLCVAHAGARGQGAGEIVIHKGYFADKLSEQFENSRNIQASIIAEKSLEPSIEQALKDEACVFYPFDAFQGDAKWQGGLSAFLAEFDQRVEQVWHSVPYDIDGVICQVLNADVQQTMGATRKFHRWQIAFKRNAESAQVKVRSVRPQTSRTGRLTPVAELEPTKLSGATISRATVHHYGMVKAKGVGEGAVVELVRSGLVIPKIQRVLASVAPDLPENCPSCGSKVVWDGDHLMCLNREGCPAQAENRLMHFFKTLGNIDGFGPKVIETLHKHGVQKVSEVYALTESDFLDMGYKEKTSSNLYQQLQESRRIATEDWRFLAAMGVNRLGPGSCERLLEHHALADVLSVTPDALVAIDGFAELTAKMICSGLQAIKEEFLALLALGFNLNATVRVDAKTAGEHSAISGKTLVFTGVFSSGSRADMEAEAKALGAKVVKSVSAKTDYLVAGDKVGASKLAAAENKGVEIITEEAYRAWLTQ